MCFRGQGGPCVLKGHGGPEVLGGPEAQEAREARDTPEAWETKEAQLHREPIGTMLPIRKLDPN